MDTIQTECKRCGTCCEKGGPALHTEDLHLIKDGRIPINNLLTIREKEPVVSPISGSTEPSEQEIVKISGRDSHWTCAFYQSNDKSCVVYKDRPLECKLLKCWDTDALLDAIYTNAIARKDIIPSSAPVMHFINLQEKHCSYSELASYAMDIKGHLAYTVLDGVSRLINQDISLRQKAVNQLNLSLREELFYFGRPMFQTLEFYKMTVREKSGSLEVLVA